MIKKILLGLIIILTIVIAAAATYVYLNADSLIARIRPELEKIASEALGAPVSIGAINLGLGLKPTLSISQIGIGKSTAEKSAKKLSVERVLLSVDLIPLLSKELRITKLTIEKPHISALKTAAGIQISGLPKKPDTSQNAPAEAKSLKREENASAPLPLAFALEDFSLNDGTVSYSDQTQSGPLAQINISEISVSSGLTVNGVTVELSDSTISATINDSLPLTVKSKRIALDSKSLETTIERVILSTIDTDFTLNGALSLKQSSGKLVLNSSEINLAKLAPIYPFAPALKTIPLTGAVNIPELVVTLSGPNQWAVNGSTTLRSISAAMNGMTIDEITGALTIQAKPEVQTITSRDPLTLRFQGAPIELAFTAGLRGSKAVLEKLKISAFSGTVDATALTSLSPPQNFQTQAEIAAINIDQALAALSGKGESALSGTLESVSANLTGVLGDALKTTTAGRVSLRVKDAILKKVNIAHEAFKGVLSLPFIASRLEASLPPEIQKELAAADTKIQSISTSLRGENGNFSTDDFVLVGSFFKVRGRGTLTMQGGVDITSGISFNENFSRLLVEKVKELKSALDQNGELTFPLAISGTAPNLKITPDMNALIKLGAQAAIKEGAGKLLEKAFGGKKDGNNPGKDLGKLLGF